MRRHVVLRLALAAAATGATSPALAGSFAEDGSFLFDGKAAATIDFEEPPVDGGPATVVDEGALSGKSVLTLGQFEGVDLEVALPKTPRTYRVSVWIKGSETVGDLELRYSDRVDEVAALYPTGRITSDGWVELANERIRVDGARLVRASVGLFSAGGSSADAVEIVADGDLGVLEAEPNPKCGGVTDAAACGSEQICIWSECRNVGGWVPPIPPDREAVTDYLAARLQLLFGPFRERTVDLPASMVAIDQMRSTTDRFTYWNGFLLAVRRLHDGHTTTSGLGDFVFESPRRLSICFLEGDGDLSQAVAPKDPTYLDVLVSHTGGDHNLGLHAGDRLVAIDGQHPIAWARALQAIHWPQPAISNHETFAELASALRGLISRYAGEISVVRCDAAQGTCGAIETISIEGLPFEPPDAPYDGVFCDNRPFRHLPDSPSNHASESGDSVYRGIIVESDAVEKIYGVEWESLYTTNGSDGVGAALKAAVSSWKSNGARGVILDHRTGYGGTILAPEILWNYAVPRKADDAYYDRQLAEDEQPTPAEGQALFAKALSQGWVQYAGSVNPVTDVPVALLLTEDVSASDWLPLGFKGAPKVRLFAPFQTNGGFSTRYAFGYWLGMSYVMAVGDTLLPDGTTHNGFGVEPDEVVLPKQSDLLAGKDSVFEAALAWVRQELKP